MRPRQQQQQQTPQPSQAEMEAEQAQGHRPVVEQSGRVVFASRPGAPLSRSDSAPKNIDSGQIGDPEHDASWSKFFHANAAIPVPTPPAASTDTALPPGPALNNEDWQPDAAPTATDHIAAAVANHSNWLGRNGIDVPPPPSALSTAMDRPSRFLITPDMTKDPALQKSQFVTAGGVDPGYAARSQAFNENLYKPLDTQQPDASAPSKLVWNRTGWNGPSAPVAPGDYTSQYGTASKTNIAGLAAGGFYPQPTDS